MKIRKMLPKNSLVSNQRNLSVDAEKRTAELIWSTGYKGQRMGWEGPFYEELSLDPKSVDMSRLQPGAPLLANHDQSLESVIGVIESASVDGSKGTATVRFATDPKSEEIFQKVKDGILTGISVGYTVSKYKDVTQKNDEVPTYRAVKWTPAEISIVSTPFDPNARIRSQENELNEVEIIQLGEEMKDNEDKKVNTPEIKERNRIQSITRAVKAANLDESIAEDFIERGVSMEDAATEIFKQLNEKSNNINVKKALVQVSGTNEDVRRTALIETLANRANPNYKPQNLEATKIYQNRSMLNIFEIYYGGRKLGESDMQFAGRIFNTRAMTTSDLPEILANVAEKAMRQEYQLQPQSLKLWTKPGLLRNYKEASRLLLGDYPNLEQVGENGEVKWGSVGEAKEKIQLKRYLKGITFTKEMIINDDLGALSDFSTKGARAASRLESSLVYTNTLIANPVMNDGNALFSTAHNNYTSSGTEISLNSLAIAFAAMRKQKTVDGLDYIDISPAFLIVGPDREALARQVCSQNFLAQQSSNINVFAPFLTVVVDPRIVGNGWYLAASPGQIDTIEVARLEGEDGPLITVNPGKVPGSVDIICEHSVGCAVLDYRGLYYNVGV